MARGLSSGAGTDFEAGRDRGWRVEQPRGRAQPASRGYLTCVIVSRASAGGVGAIPHMLRLFAIAASLGSTESLIVPPQLQQPRDLTAEQRAVSGIGATTARLSIGVEDPDDLIADLGAALAAAFGG